MENPNQRPGIDTFLRGFMSSAGTGVLMSGIFYALSISASLVGMFANIGALNILHFSAASFAGAALGTTIAGLIMPAVVMVGAVGLFGGVMALKRAGEQHHGASAARSNEREPMGETPTLVPALGTGHTAAIALDEAETAAPQRAWTDRVGSGTGRDHIAEILADGSLSDKDRASAILADREASGTRAMG